MVVEGKLHIKFDTQQVSEKFAKRDFVIELQDNPLYPQHVLFQLTQDKTGLLDGHSVGDKLEVTFNLRGREWVSPQGECKYFNTLEAWRIQKANAAPATASSGQARTRSVEELADENSDCPF